MQKGLEPIYMQVSGGHLLPPVQTLGSDGSAAYGGVSDLSEWQWSTADEGFSKPRKMSGTTTGGYLYFSFSPRKRKMQIESLPAFLTKGKKVSGGHFLSPWESPWVMECNP